MKNVKRLVSLILVLSLLILPVPVNVEATANTTEGDWQYYIADDYMMVSGCDGAVITAYNGTAADVVIPETLGGSSVIAIGSEVFKENDQITSVTIPASLKYSQSYAFEDCTNLENVYISDLAAWCTIEFLGDFEEYYIFPTSNPLWCAENLYLNGVLVTELVIPEGVTNINNHAFISCESLTSVTIPDSVQTIGKSAFYECSNLSVVNLGKGVNSVSSYAFGSFLESPLTLVFYAGTQEQWSAIAIDNYNSELTNVTRHYQDEGHTVSVTETCSAVSHTCTACGVILCVEKTPSHVFADGVCIHCGVESGWNYSPNADGTVSVTGYTGKDVAVTVPATIEGMSVTAIAYPCFFDNDILTSITIPQSVKSIEDGSFYSCNKLADVHVSDLSAWCDIEIKENPGYYFYFSAANPLYWAENLYLNDQLVTDLVIPEGVTQINDYAFYGCESLTSVTIPNSVQTINDYAFCYCESITSVTIPDSVQAIGDSAFRSCSKLTSAAIGTGVTSIDYEAFYSCDKLEDVYISDLAAWCGIDFSGSWSNPLCYAENLYLNGELVTDLVIPEGVTEIKDYAFYGCDSITSVTIPDSVQTIGDSAFRYCYNLAVVVLDKGVTSIGNYAFGDYDSWSGNSVKHVLYTGTQAQWDAVSLGGGNINLTDATWHYADEGHTVSTTQTCSMVKYNCTQCGQIAAVTKSIPSHVFVDGICTICGMESGWSYSPNADGTVSVTGYTGTAANVVIPATIEGMSVTAIADSTFRYNSTIKSVTIPETVETIGISAFEDCSNLAMVVLGKGVTTIGDYAFGLYYTSAPVFVKHVLYTGTQAQWNAIAIGSGNKNLTDATRHYNASGDMVTSVHSCSYTRLDCEECGTVAMTIAATPAHSFNGGSCTHCGVSPDWKYTCTSEGTVTFDGYTGTAPKLTIPTQIEGLPVVTIASKAFYNNTVLTEVVIPDSVQTIGGSAFVYCKNLTLVTIGNGVITLGASAFRNCTSLETIVIPEGVEKIGNYTFSGCTALSAVTLPASVTEVYEWAFYNCKNLDHVLYGGTQAQQEAMLIDGTNDTFLTATWHCGVDETSIQLSSRELCSAVALFDCDVCDATCWQAKDSSEHTFVDGKCTTCDLAENCPWSYAINGTGVEITGYDSTLGGSTPKIPETIEGLPVTAIGNRALLECDSITSITIPETVETIGYSAFRDCAQLLNVYFGGTQEQWEEILVDSNNAPLLEALLKYLADVITGDVNGDDTVTRDDAIRVLLYVLNPTRFPLDAEADFNGDSTVTRDDAIRLLLYVLNPSRFPLETQ